MSWLNDIRIRTRLVLVSVLPIVGMIFFAWLTVAEKNRIHGEAQEVERLVGFATQISALVHELQKERGSSALFIGSKGTQFKAELQTQRLQTDEKLNRYNNAVAKLDKKEAGILASLLSAADANLKNVVQARSGVDSLALSPQQAIGNYTATIAKLIDAITFLASLTTDPHSIHMLTSYGNLIIAKELAGQERATGSAGFANKAFDKDLYQRFVSLGARQVAMFDEFYRHASDKHDDLLRQALERSETKEAEKLREIARASVFNNSTGDVQAPVWFKATTAYIDVLKEVEDKIATDLISLADGIKAGAKSSLITMLVLAGLALLAVLVLTPLIGNSIVGPIGDMTQVMTKLSAGHLDVTVHGTEAQAETGEMARSVLVFQQNMQERRRLEAEQVEIKRRAEEERKAAMHRLADSFEASVLAVVHSVEDYATTMQGTARTVQSNARQTSDLVLAATSASEQTSGNVQTVAAAAEELSSAITEISRQVSNSSSISSNAVREASRADSMVRGLAEAAGKIGEVVQLINDIASQTNLLALNATIEAARAGEAGKGFAVVANEVKHLANQTAKATEEISSQINSVQAATNDAVGAIKGIGDVIAQINEIAASIAAAVEEQGSATQEIARNVLHAADGTKEVASSMVGVTAAANETGSVSNTVLDAANKLTEHSKTLNSEVNRFLNTVRSA